ncbi:MAG: hypothetical protein M3Y84_09400 [Acidobacteriota bacterium]|nr:hypothetical protein [Acidobacteriota bacterium]
MSDRAVGAGIFIVTNLITDAPEDLYPAKIRACHLSRGTPEVTQSFALI